jgi:amino acid permease
VREVGELGGYDLTDSCWNDGRLLLGLMILFVQLPLAFFQHVNFLGFTSFIGMGCMMSFVGLVVRKQPEAAALCHTTGINYTQLDIDQNQVGPDPTCETENFIFNLKSAYAVPILLFAFMCHGNVLSIVAELRPSVECRSDHPSPGRLRKMILGAMTPTAILYMTTALFAYYSYFNRTASFLLELYGLWLDGDAMLIVSKILVTLCITFSVPILHYPCRYSLWNLLHQLFPTQVPQPYDNGYPQTWNWKWFYLFAIVIQGGMYILVCITDDFALVAALGGAIAGSCVVFIFPAMFYLKTHNWKSDTVYDKTVWFVGGVGGLIFVANTGLILYDYFFLQAESSDALPQVVASVTMSLDVNATVY